MFRRLGIARQIYGSFGVLIALLAAMCIASFLGLQSIADILANFRQTPAQTAITGSLAYRISAVQQAAVAYRVTYGKAQAIAFNNALELVN
jgi:CHASE3 domain sensor protein